MPEQDVHNFSSSSSSSSHRLPTVSASQALLSLNSVESRAISTGLPRLDGALQVSSSSAPAGNAPYGVPRGHVTEIYGPPASGKTCFGMQLATNALRAGHSVVWVDTASPLPGSRFKEILSSTTLLSNEGPPCSPPTMHPLDSLLTNFTSIQTPTLPHLLALFVHLPQHFPPDRTALIIIDSVSAIFSAAYPKASEARFRAPQGDSKRKDAVQWAANRRWSVAGSLLAQLGKLAATRNLAVVVINQTTTQLRGTAGAMLGCAISGSAWDAGISSRIVLYRDLVSDSRMNSHRTVRFAAVLKASGRAVDETSPAAKPVPFAIASSGLHPVSLASKTNSAPHPTQPPAVSTHPKRKRDEIPDSEDDEESPSSEDEYGLNEWDVLVALQEDVLKNGNVTAALQDDHFAELEVECAADGDQYS